jgi:hypothetical protein
MTAAAQKVRSIMLVAAAAGLSACLGNDPGGPIPETRITRLQAFYCATHTTGDCQVRGDSIPSGTLPPADESFMVWVWHPGFNTTRWRLKSSLDDTTLPDKVAQDSNATPVTLSGAPAKRYSLRVQIIGVNNSVLAEDSLVWDYP